MQLRIVLAWWVLPSHRVTWTGFVINSVLLLYLSTLPAYFLVAVNRLKRVNSALDVPFLRVAFVVTRAPSEPWPIARATLEAMSAQDYPHPYDVWLCDENPTTEILDWCGQSSVQVSNRYGVTDYHQADWPRRTKCKEGNLAYFYDRIAMTRTTSWRNWTATTCRRRPTWPRSPDRSPIRRSATWQRPASVTATRARPGRPVGASTKKARSTVLSSSATTTGTHRSASARTMRSARRHCDRSAGRTGTGGGLLDDVPAELGGLGRGVRRYGRSHGDGPQTVAALLTQEFQWSRSLVTLLYDMLPMHLHRFHRRLRFRFVFALSYYPLLVLTSIAGVVLPVYAAVTGVPWINVGYIDFTIRWFCITVWLLAITLLVRRRGLLRPRGAPILSWENWLYTVVRWPFIAWGVFAATLQKIRPRPVGFKSPRSGSSGSSGSRSR